MPFIPDHATGNFVGRDQFVRKYPEWEVLLVDPSEEWLRTGKAVDEFDDWVKAAKDPGRVIRYAASSEIRDRDDEEIALAGWKTRNYMRYRAILWAHHYHEPVIGNAIRLRRSEGFLYIWVEYMPAEVYEWADQIFKIVQWGMPAGSVGFRPLKWEYGDPSKGEPRVRYLEQELLEFSPCPVGSNPEALAASVEEHDPTLASKIRGEEFKAKYWSGFDPKTTRATERFNIKDIIDHPEGKDFIEVLRALPDIMKWPVTTKGREIVDRFPVEFFPQLMKLVDTKAADDAAHFLNMNLARYGIGASALKEDELPCDAISLIGEEIENEKPFAGEHACRLLPPGNFDSFRRTNCYFKVEDKCVDVVWGIKEGAASRQSLRFKTAVWTKAAAKKYCADKGGFFEAAAEDAIGDLREKLINVEAGVEAILFYIKTVIIPRLSGSAAASSDGEQAPTTGPSSESGTPPGEAGLPVDEDKGVDSARSVNALFDQASARTTGGAVSTASFLLDLKAAQPSRTKKGGEK